MSGRVPSFVDTAPLPRNLTRTAPASDVWTCDVVNRALGATGHPGLRNVCSEVEDGVVRLSGAVRSYYLKQLAQTAVLRIDGVSGIQNDVEVV